jgi:hypothetical protein
MIHMSLWHVFKSDDLGTWPRATRLTFFQVPALRRSLQSSVGDTSKITLPNSALPGATVSSTSSSLTTIA